MASMQEIMQLCRLCLVKDQVNTPIFEEVDDISQIFLKISACLPVKVTREDKLPKRICDSCSYKLELFYDFWNTSVNSEKQLTTWLTQLGADKPSLSKVINTFTSHDVNPIILKQELPELLEVPSVDELSPSEDLNISETQDYVLQQQQLPYEGVEFEFQQEGFLDGHTSTNVLTSSATVASEITVVGPRRKRQATNKVESSDFESEDDDLDSPGSKIAKIEDEGINDATKPFINLPSTSNENDEPGPSGVGKAATDAPFWKPLNAPIKLEQPDYDVFTKNGLWICNICDQSFANNADVIDHVYTADLEMYLCCRCGSKFVDEKTFRLHLRDHKQQTLQLQQTAGFASPSGKIIDSRVNNMFICKYCDAPFRDRAIFYNHSISHTSISKVKSKPTVKKVIETFELANRINMDFKVEKLYYGIKYRCKKCHMAFFNLDRNVAHSDKCVGLLKSCDLCCSNFNSNLKLFHHYEVVHSNRRRMCTYCFNTFNEDKSLMHHIIKLHLNFSHYCYDCNEGFVSMYKFNNHIKKHS